MYSELPVVTKQLRAHTTSNHLPHRNTSKNGHASKYCERGFSTLRTAGFGWSAVCRHGRRVVCPTTRFCNIRLDTSDAVWQVDTDTGTQSVDLLPGPECSQKVRLGPAGQSHQLKSQLPRGQATISTQSRPSLRASGATILE